MATGESSAGISQRQTGQGADLLLELVRGAGIEGVVPAVVRSGRQFVDQQPVALDHEELDRHVPT